MEINIKDYIKSSFENTTKEDIKESIEESIKKNDDIILPGLGVLFELLWNNSDNEMKQKIIDLLDDYFKQQKSIT
ncbi:MAG TPA: hypothetical protein GXZ95_00085 [Mollicutes bacterium]|nr:hypothetical protein [Mollicutes bacterium]